MITKAADKIEALVEQAFREKMTEQNYERLHLIIENEDGKVQKMHFDSHLKGKVSDILFRFGKLIFWRSFTKRKRIS